MAIKIYRMTLREWRTCDSPYRMLNFLENRASDRKLRLFAAACCRYRWDLLAPEVTRQAIVTVEDFADGKATPKQLEQAGDSVRAILSRMRDTPQYPWTIARADDWNPVHQAMDAVSACTWPRAFQAARGASHCSSQAVRWASLDECLKPDLDYNCDLLRDIFGNPFQPCAFDPAWVTSTVSDIAQTIYEERRFADMPILGDALEEAGCLNEEMLVHCRGGNEHVRGCWVVDLILGRN